MTSIAVIPARGGSKRIPRKNIKEFCGKPIIAYSIEAALNSDCFDRVVVSTDDEEIAGVAKQYGAEVPFIRPKEIADDYSGTNVVVAHTLKWLYDNEDVTCEQVCCLYATAPFITPEVLQQGKAALAMHHDCDYAVTVAEFLSPVQKAMYIGKDDFLEMKEPEFAETRSQDLITCYHDAGQMYWSYPKFFEQDARVFTHRVFPVILPPHLVQDIDTMDDWYRAEVMYTANLKLG